MPKTFDVEATFMTGMEVGVHKGCGGIVLLTDKEAYYCLTCHKEQASNRTPNWVYENWRHQKRKT